MRWRKMGYFLVCDLEAAETRRGIELLAIWALENRKR